jgi:hypothetical protein
MTTALEGGEGSASRPGRSLPGTHCTRGCVGPGAGLDRCGKSCHHRDSIPGPSSPQPVKTQETNIKPETVNRGLTNPIKIRYTSSVLPVYCFTQLQNNYFEVSILLGCGASLLDDWYPTFRDTVMVSYARIKMSIPPKIKKKKKANPNCTATNDDKLARLYFTCHFVRMWSTISLTHREQTQHGSACDEWPEDTAWIYERQ